MTHASGGHVAAWCERFLDEKGVAVAPGSAFGASGEGWIRVCVASDREGLVEGLRRLPAPAAARPSNRRDMSPRAQHPLAPSATPPELIRHFCIIATTAPAKPTLAARRLGVTG